MMVIDAQMIKAGDFEYFIILSGFDDNERSGLKLLRATQIQTSIA